MCFGPKKIEAGEVFALIFKNKQTKYMSGGHAGGGAGTGTGSGSGGVVRASDLAAATHLLASAEQMTLAATTTFQPRDEHASGDPSYTYSTVDQVRQMNDKENVNIYGYVLSMDPPRKSRGDDFVLHFRIADAAPNLEDESEIAEALSSAGGSVEHAFEEVLDEDRTIHLNVFARSADLLPNIKKRFDVIRLHRVKKSIFTSKTDGEVAMNLVGQIRPRFSGKTSFLLFDAEVGGAEVPYQAQPQRAGGTVRYHDSEHHRQRLAEIRNIAALSRNALEKLTAHGNLPQLGSSAGAGAAGAGAGPSSSAAAATGIVHIPSVNNHFLRKLTDLRRVPAAAGAFRYVDLHAFVVRVVLDYPREGVATILLWDGTDIAPASPIPTSTAPPARYRVQGPPGMVPPHKFVGDSQELLKEGFDVDRVLPAKSVNVNADKWLESLDDALSTVEFSTDGVPVIHACCPKYGSVLPLIVPLTSPHSPLTARTILPAEHKWVRLKNVGVRVGRGAQLQAMWINDASLTKARYERCQENLRNAAAAREKENKAVDFDLLREQAADMNAEKTHIAAIERGRQKTAETKRKNAEKRKSSESQDAEGAMVAVAANAAAPATDADADAQAGDAAPSTSGAGPSSTPAEATTEAPLHLTEMKLQDEDPRSVGPSPHDIEVYKAREVKNETASYAPTRGNSARYVCKPTKTADDTKFSTIREILLDQSGSAGKSQTYRIRCQVQSMEPKDLSRACRSLADVKKAKGEKSSQADESVYLFAMKMNVEDATGKLTCNITGDAAITFFTHLTKPCKLSDHSLYAMQAACDALTRAGPHDTASAQEWHDNAMKYTVERARNGGKEPAILPTLRQQPWCDLVVREDFASNKGYRYFSLADGSLEKDVCAFCWNVANERTADRGTHT